MWGAGFRVEEDLGVAPNAQSQGGAGGRSEVGGVKRRPPGQRTREPSAARAVVAVARCRPALLLSVFRVRQRVRRDQAAGNARVL